MLKIDEEKRIEERDTEPIVLVPAKPMTEETTENRIPFYRPSIFYVQYIEQRYPSFEKRLNILPTLEKHCIHFDISSIIRYYCKSDMIHQEKYIHLRTKKPSEYDIELIAHTKFVDSLYQLHRFRTFASSLLRYAHYHMPNHVEYFTNTTHLTLADLKQEEALHQEKLMSTFQHVHDMLSVVEDVPPCVWNRYMESIFPNTPGYRIGYAIHRLLKCIYDQFQLYLNSTVSVKHVRIEESNQFVPVEYNTVLRQEYHVKMWIDKLYEKMCVM